MTGLATDISSALVAWQVYWAVAVKTYRGAWNKTAQIGYWTKIALRREDVVSRSGFELASVDEPDEETGRARGRHKSVACQSQSAQREPATNLLNKSYCPMVVFMFVFSGSSARITYVPYLKVKLVKLRETVSS